jgi:hypothetical protein
MISDEDVERALDYLRDNVGDAARARAVRIFVTEFRKTLKAQIMKENVEMPLGAQEREAYADPRYVEHLEAIRDAVEADAKHEFLRKAAEAKIEAWRTQSSNERAMKL